MFLRNSISSIWKSKEMSSEVKRGQNAGNIECLRPGGGAPKKQLKLPNFPNVAQNAGNIECLRPGKGGA